MSEDEIDEITKNGLCSYPAVSVICCLHKHPDCGNNSKDESAPSNSAPGHGFLPANEENVSGILKSNQLIISCTSTLYSKLTDHPNPLDYQNEIKNPRGHT